MKYLFYPSLVIVLLMATQPAYAQIGCPGCTVSIPASFAADTVYLPALPSGEEGEMYNANVSFRLPKTTTPVYAIDSVTPPGLTISRIEILGVEGLPQGLAWQANQLIFEPPTQTDGCFRICGKPLANDTFELTVKLKATVLFISQETSFPMRLIIAPPTSNSDGFSMTNYIGCGPTRVSFTNNHPSGGQAGFTYSWDFGDGSAPFTGENPAPRLYSQTGTYIVKYSAVIDTVGPVLRGFTILDASCSDALGLGAPDIYAFIKGPNGAEIFNTGPNISNASFPLAFPADLTLGTGNYTLEVWDEDSGLEGTDDQCGAISFNILSNDTLVAGGLTVILNIERPIVEIMSVDTIFVYNRPVAPVISAAGGLTACAGDPPVSLNSSYGTGNQWFFNGQPLPGPGNFFVSATQPGYYSVQFTSVDGCRVMSDSVRVEYYPLPAAPVFTNTNNRLRADTSVLPERYALQWYRGAAPITGATGITYCATMNGNYGLQVRDLDTDCEQFFYLNVIFNPAFNCTVGTDETAGMALRLYPNPIYQGTATLELSEALDEPGQLHYYDVLGRLAHRQVLAPGAQVYTLDVSPLSPGVYMAELRAGKIRLVQRVVVEGGRL
jgi:Secretion system C-terminal sorting domain